MINAFGRDIRRGHIKILDRLRFSPPPRDPGPTAPQAKKKCNLSAAKVHFLMIYAVMFIVSDFRRAAGVDFEIFGF